MTPDDVRKDCVICGGRTWSCQYHAGYEDGYEAAQRERAKLRYAPYDAAILPPQQADHFASETPQGRCGQ